ncbi:TniB family NTP-binding protein [Indioceanicola profundi]|uniref:TniB family NTP-binding protein n=1 Tax=Indioceanicola profundi TaxID=2220096 RepID=UPI000E6AA0C4|nr:TniB family NTP-binding protein [Indioceanicola profundi]
MADASMVQGDRVLTEEARAVLNAPDDQRIYFIRESVWIDHPTVEDIMQVLNDTMEWPDIHRMPWVMIHGPGASGKTALLREFMAQHKSLVDESQEADRNPIVYISGGGGSGGESALYNQLMIRLRSKLRISNKEDKKLHVSALLRATGVRMLVIDEGHDFLIGSDRERRQFWAALKYLCNEQSRSLVMAGTQDLLSGMLADDQIDTRFEEPFEMRRWAPGPEWDGFLALYEARLPLRKESELWQPKLSNWLLDMSDGLTGEAVNLMKKAAVKAIRDKAERITMKTFENMRVRQLRRR